MRLFAYEAGKDKDTICHGPVLYQIKSRYKKARYQSGLHSDCAYALSFTAHDFTENSGQDTTANTARSNATN